MLWRVFPSLLSGQNLFDSIKSEPFSIPEDDGNDLTHTFFNPDREGWLLKLGETVLTHAGDAHRRACTLTPRGCHTHALDMQPRGYSQVSPRSPDPWSSSLPVPSVHLSVLGIRGQCGRGTISRKWGREAD